MSIMKKSIYSDEHKCLVEKIKQARKAAGLNQEKVAKLLGVTHTILCFKSRSGTAAY